MGSGGKGGGVARGITRLGDGPAERTGDFTPAMSFGHPSGEVVDEGAYTYTAPSSTPSYMTQTCRSVRSTGRWPVGAVAQPGAHFFAGDSKKIMRRVLPSPRFSRGGRAKILGVLSALAVKSASLPLPNIFASRENISKINRRLTNHEDRIMKVKG